MRHLLCCTVTIKEKRWSNIQISDRYFLIDPKRLLPVYAALDECYRHIASRSIPTFQPNKRLVPLTKAKHENWLLEPDLEEQHFLTAVSASIFFRESPPVFQRLLDAIRELKDFWDDSLRAAESQFPHLKQTPAIPRRDDLHLHFLVWGEYTPGLTQCETDATEGGCLVSTKSILGEYSVVDGNM